MSFRALLPVAQAVFTITLVLTSSGAPRFRAASRCDWEPSAYCGPLAVPAVIGRLVEANLPAAPVLAASYLWLGDPDHPNLPLLVTLFGLAGIGIWFFVGQLLDDIAAALLKHASPRRHIYDGLFSVFVVISSCVVFVESDITSFALLADKEMWTFSVAFYALLDRGQVLH
jgi:hypothetical protein